jgi:anti-sigma factor RsiW
MICPLRKEDTAHVLLDYTAGRLDALQMAALEQHMESCAECAAFRAQQAVVWDALDTWEPSPVSLDFNRRLWQRIDTAEAEPWYRRLAESFRFAQWKPVLPLTAAILLMAAGFLFDHQDSQVSTQTTPAIARSVSVSEADQVEQTLDDIQLLRQLNGAATSRSGAKM